MTVLSTTDAAPPSSGERGMTRREKAEGSRPPMTTRVAVLLPTEVIARSVSPFPGHHGPSSDLIRLGGNGATAGPALGTRPGRPHRQQRGRVLRPRADHLAGPVEGGPGVSVARVAPSADRLLGGEAADRRQPADLGLQRGAREGLSGGRRT